MLKANRSCFTREQIANGIYDDTYRIQCSTIQIKDTQLTILLPLPPKYRVYGGDMFRRWLRRLPLPRMQSMI